MFRKISIRVDGHSDSLERPGLLRACCQELCASGSMTPPACRMALTRTGVSVANELRTDPRGVRSHYGEARGGDETR